MTSEIGDNSKPTMEEMLNALHAQLVQEFIDRVSSGEATPADLNAARQLLKDNEITQPVISSKNKEREAEDPMEVLKRQLPFTEKE